MHSLRENRFSHFDWTALGGLLAGAVLFLFVYGPSTLDPTYDSWIFAGYIGGDVQQHYTGWAAFRAGKWSFPLTNTANISYPLGGAICFTDSLPLLAVPLKLFSFALPETFQYFGIFVFASMMLTGYAGARLLGLFGVSAPARLLGSFLFAGSPVLLERAFQHTSLAAQWLVVGALVLYFKSRRTGFEKQSWGFVALGLLATSIHLYFLPMVLAIALATAVDGMVATRSPQPLKWLLTSVAASVALAALLGFFTASDYIPGGYGDFGLNLNAFVNPASYNWPTWNEAYQNLLWSRFLPELPVLGNSTGSFAYLGLGVLAGLLLAVVLGLWWWLSRTPHLGGVAAQWPPEEERVAELGTLLPTAISPSREKVRYTLRRFGQFLHSHAGLLLCLLCLAVFAVSNVVTLNGRELLRVSLPEGLLRFADIFRSSGRLIWPVYYLVITVAVVAVSRLAKAIFGENWVAPVLVCALLLLQLLDMWNVVFEKRAYFKQPVVPETYTAPEGWEEIARPGRAMYVLEPHEDRLNAMRAALAGMPSNFSLLARGDIAAMRADMDATREILLNGRLPAFNGVFLTTDPDLAVRLTRVLRSSCDRVDFDGYTAFMPKTQVATAR